MIALRNGSELCEDAVGKPAGLTMSDVKRVVEVKGRTQDRWGEGYDAG